MLDEIKQGRNHVFIGPGGCGKSYTLRQLYHELPKNKVAITSTTGISAINLHPHATTFHKWTGFQLAKQPKEELLLHALSPDGKYIRKTWRSTKYLIIDEMSMISRTHFEKMEWIGRQLLDPNLPFGGITLIVSGDFLQLPPINDDFVFLSEVWEKMNFKRVSFSTPYRYSNLDWFGVLLKIRIGLVDEEVRKALESRVIDIPDDDIQPTILYPKKKDVLEYNLAKLEELEEEEVEFEADDTFIKVKAHYQYNILKQLVSQIAPEVINLKVGAQVMITKNKTTSHPEYINGTRAIVTKISDMYVLVKTRKGNTLCISPEEFEVETKMGKIVRMQYPLALAWATTIHKSQGLTLDWVYCDIGDDIFEDGQAYVALSRIRDMEGLFLKGVKFEKIRANKIALSFEDGTR